ncbi:hypothetical protein, partial [Escherichia coli]|uniref:hypothetical protein n=1 Tax=Escherichia coli TaxID=562 RepID=UPI00227F6F8F
APMVSKDRCCSLQPAGAGRIYLRCKESAAHLTLRGCVILFFSNQWLYIIAAETHALWRYFCYRVYSRSGFYLFKPPETFEP